jgi:hypothetical protein
LSRYSKPHFRGMRMAVLRLPRAGPGGSQESEAVPVPAYEELPWIPAEQWPAWRLRVRAEAAVGNLTRARRDALTALLGLLCTGDVEPSDAEVAEVAGCSTRTVRRARADARALGMLRWTRTRQLRGERLVQGRNRYQIAVPNGPVCPKPTDQTDRKSAQGRQKERREAREAPRTAANMPVHVAATALEAIRRRRAAQLGFSG